MSELEHENLWQDQSGKNWSLDWYGLREGTVDCSELFPKEQLHLMFNIAGQGIGLGDRTRIAVSTSTISMCYPRSKVRASRLAGSGNHEFVILSMKQEWLKDILGEKKQSIYKTLWAAVDADTSIGKPVGHVRSMTMSEKEMATQLSDPPVEGGAMEFWYTAKVMEIIALHLFRSPEQTSAGNEEPFCLSRKRVLNERVEQVNEWLEENLEESLDLQQLAKHVGCAPHYLSRIFSQEVGKTISQQLRAMRIKKAAELMDTGKFNVTEAAFEVGYNSLSHFTKAFATETGVKPSVYLTQ